jgi:cytochrome c553
VCTPCEKKVSEAAFGETVVPSGVPDLAGQRATCLASQLRADRSGAGELEDMAVMANPLTDDNDLSLAAWLNSIQV